MLTTRSQRWRDRRSHWVPADSPIDTRCFSVDVIDTVHRAAPFVRQHHYAGTMPAARLSVGLFRNGTGGGSELAGVCVFAHPVNDASVPKSAGLADARAACDLGRFVLLDDTGGNAETWFLSRAFRLLRREKPGIFSVISYADPVRRIGAEGRVFMPGHVGGIYAVMGSRYTGRASARTDLILPNGQPISGRALSKIKGGETGRRYAEDQLLAAGARMRRSGEAGVDWLDALEHSGFLRRRRHPGNHVYLFALTRAARIAAQNLPDLPYPVLDRSTRFGDVTALPLLRDVA